MADVKTNGTEGPGHSLDQSTLSEPLLIAFGSCLGEKASRLFFSRSSTNFLKIAPSSSCNQERLSALVPSSNSA